MSDTLQTKALGVSPEIIDTDEEKSVKTAISSKSIDRDDDILYPEGLNQDKYKDNPIVLWGHNQSQPPIAKSAWVKTEGEKVISKAMFNKDSSWSMDIFGMIKSGFINATSVGFIPKETEKEETDEVIEFWGYKFPRVIRHIKKWELVEYSFVSAPANPDALVLRDISTVEAKALALDLVKKDAEANIQKQIMESYSDFKKEMDSFAERVNGFNEKLIAVQDGLAAIKEREPIDLSGLKTEVQKELDALNSQLSGISGELGSIKNAQEKQALNATIQEAITGEIKKLKGNVDHYFN